MACLSAGYVGLQTARLRSREGSATHRQVVANATLGIILGGLGIIPSRGCERSEWLVHNTGIASKTSPAIKQAVRCIFCEAGEVSSLPKQARADGGC